MVIAPVVVQVRNVKVSSKGERAHVVDNSGDFACALVTRFRWQCWWKFDSPAARCSADRVHHQYGFRAKGRLGGRFT